MQTIKTMIDLESTDFERHFRTLCLAENRTIPNLQACKNSANLLRIHLKSLITEINREMLHGDKDE